MKTYTENDLRKLVELIDDSYRPYTRDNFQGSNVLEEFLRGDFENLKEETVSFTYSFLRRKLEWSDICELTGVDYYAINNGFEIKDSEVFEIKESKAKEYNLI